MIYILFALKYVICYVLPTTTIVGFEPVAVQPAAHRPHTVTTRLGVTIVMKPSVGLLVHYIILIYITIIYINSIPFVSLFKVLFAGHSYDTPQQRALFAHFLFYFKKYDCFLTPKIISYRNDIPFSFQKTNSHVTKPHHKMSLQWALAAILALLCCHVVQSGVVRSKEEVGEYHHRDAIWRHDIPNHRQSDCLFNNMFDFTRKEPKLCITGLL